MSGAGLSNFLRSVACDVFGVWSFFRNTMLMWLGIEYVAEGCSTSCVARSLPLVCKTPPDGPDFAEQTSGGSRGHGWMLVGGTAVSV